MGGFRRNEENRGGFEPVGERRGSKTLHGRFEEVPLGLRAARISPAGLLLGLRPDAVLRQ